jgi:hypothetical protein
MSPSLPLVAVWLAAMPAVAQEANPRAEALARRCTSCVRSLEYLRREAGALRDPALRRLSLSLLDDPAPTFMARLQAPEARAGVHRALVEAGLLDAKVSVDELLPPLPPLSFLAAPGSSTDGHHAYPGGLAEHTAFNVAAALALAETYRARYPGLAPLRHDLLVAAALAHDAMKAWCLQWHSDGTLPSQVRVAGTAAHHVLMIAEAFHRGLAPELLVVLAAAHDPPLGEGAARVVGFLRAAALLAGVDPVARGVLVRDGTGFALARPAPIEAAVNHIADHDYVLTDPAGHVIADCLARLLRATPDAAKLDDAHLRWARHRVLGRVTLVRLYQAFSDGGDEAVRALLAREKVPLVLPEDLR